MKDVIKWFLKRLFGDYALYYIYSLQASEPRSLVPNPSGLDFVVLDQSAIQASGDTLISDQGWHHGDECHAYGYVDGVRIVALCFFWFGNRYRKRNFWPLSDQEAKLVQIVTLPEVRGQGIGSALIANAGDDMFKKGFRRIYARIWHSNAPSRRAFERAGWERIALVVEINPRGKKKPLRIKLPVVGGR